MRPLLIAAVALLAVGIANIDVRPTRTRVVRVPVTKIVQKVKTVHVVEPARLDGYMTRYQCDTLGRDTGFRDVIMLYGWPAGTNGSDSYSGMLYYPLRGDSKHGCTVDFWRNRVESTKIERYY